MTAEPREGYLPRTAASAAAATSPQAVESTLSRISSEIMEEAIARRARAAAAEVAPAK